MDIHIPLEKLELDDFPHRLVGKFFTNSTPPSLEETESSLREQWPRILPENMIVRTQDNDRFLLNFKQKKDKEFVLLEGPWVINKVMLIIKEFTSDEIDFTVTDLCVTVVGLPLFYHNRTEVLSHIKTLLSHGHLQPTLIYRTKLFIFFRAVTDLKKPIKPGFFISENRYVEFKYKNIGDFCYNCGIIGHVKSNCDQEFPKERVLNATSKTSVYGPWLRLYIIPNLFEMVLKLCDEEKEEDIKECEKTLPYPQFFVKISFNEVAVRNSADSSIFASSSHSFRFPCSYLDSSDLSTSKAREVIENEFDENPLFSVKDMNREKSNLICSILENMNVIRKNSEDKWLPLKLEIYRRYSLTPVTYETILASRDDLHCVEEIERKMSELVKKKVEEQYHLDCVSLWEVDIREALADIGYFDYPYLFDVTARAEQAIREANELQISSITCPIPAEREAVEKLECKKVIGSEIDKLDPCVICSLEMFLGEEVTVLPCSHVFHSLCVHEWFKVGHKCPLCGFKLPLQE